MSDLKTDLRRAAVLLAIAMVLGAPSAGVASGGPDAGDPSPGSPAGVSDLRVYAHSFQHQTTGEVLAFIRPLLSPRGTVEEHPAAGTLVIRDAPEVIAQIIPLLEALDHPPEEVRLEIHVLQAGPYRPAPISPPQPRRSLEEAGLPPELVARLRGLLRYDHYQVLAQAGLSSKEGEEVTYALDPRYSVSFRLGAVMAQQRLRLEGFRFVRRPPESTNKGRRLEPEELFHATLNLWRERPFALVLSQDEERQEALMVAISWRREEGAGAAEPEAANLPVAGERQER